MSQENYYKRHRADGAAGPLSQLDLNQFQNGSNIPQLSSSIKRASGRFSNRQSLIGAPRTNVTAQKRSSAMGLTDMVQQSALRSTGRKSLGGGMNSVSRPTHRASSFGLGGLTPQNKDPRPLREKNYQYMMQQDIMDYLISHGFEGMMKHPLSAKTLKTPTQKDFVLIFQFLYKQIDPAYVFVRSIEHDVFALLKNIKYPFLDSINKSQISAVGGHNWPVFLGIIHWLVQLVNKMEMVSNLDIPVGVELSDVDVKELEQEKIFVSYIVKSYNAFLNNVDEYSEFYDQMEAEYQSYTEHVVSETDALEKENQELRQTHDKLVVEAESLNSVAQKAAALDKDLFKFKGYITSMIKRKEKWGDALSRITEELNNSEAMKKQAEEEKRQLQQQMRDQGLTPQDIDRMHTERDRYSKSIDAVNMRLHEVQQTLEVQDANAQQARAQLAEVLKQYNHNILSIVSTMPDHDKSTFIIKLENLLKEPHLGLQPEALLKGHDIKGKLRQNLQTLKATMIGRLHKAQDDVESFKEELDSLQETIRDKSEHAESLEARLSTMQLEYEEFHGAMSREVSSQHAELLKFETELKQIQISSEQNARLLEQHIKTVDMEYMKLKAHVEQSREALREKTMKMITDVVNFKLNIQGSLEELEDVIVAEMKEEKDEQIFVQ